MRKTAQVRHLWTPSPARAPRPKSTPHTYEEFDQIDGRHPFANAVSASCVHYQVRKLQEGKIAYFNFNLAAEMGLITKNHPHRMNKQLEQKLIETFSIRIINEYDVKRKTKFDPQTLKPYPHMATRYLQLQHKNKRGQTSGDGRSIWNGVVRHKGKIWDVNSRGTGVTCLSPGFVQAGKPLKTGGTEFGYGCGTADIDELISAALMSEVYHREGLKTERVLAIVDLGNGIGIGVRASQNLFRPAHMFALLKQGDRRNLARMTDFVIRRQVQNSQWKITSTRGHKYDQMLHYLARDFARFAAHLEAAYMFVWLDWDGDNVLVDPGIIDYGSVRQFGLFHDSYRYDDIDRFSTNILEQRRKARQIVQSFAQMFHFLKTGRKPHAKKFKKHWSALLFNREFERHRLQRFLAHLGFDEKQAGLLLKKRPEICRELFEINRYFETQKTKRKAIKLPDGYLKPAIYNMRYVWLELPQRLAENSFAPITELEFFTIMLAESASGTDLKYKQNLTRRILRFQTLYMELTEACPGAWRTVLKNISVRAGKLSRPNRITGNGVECVTEELIRAYNKGLNPHELQKVMEAFIQSQSGGPVRQLILLDNPTSRSLLEKSLELIHTYKEDI